MHPICGFLAIAQATQGAPTETIRVNHMRPSKLVAILNEFQPSTVLTADDERGLIYVKAGKEKAAEYRIYASLFDVKMRRVKVRIDADSQIDRTNSSLEAEVSQNKSFTFSDSGMDLEVKFAIRLGDDNSVAMIIASTYEKKTSSVVLRTKSGEGFSLCLTPDGRIGYQADTSENVLKNDTWQMLRGAGAEVARTTEVLQPGQVRKWPILRIKASILEESPASGK
jgi:hypothetical protein